MSEKANYNLPPSREVTEQPLRNLADELYEEWVTEAQREEEVVRLHWSNYCHGEPHTVEFVYNHGCFERAFLDVSTKDRLDLSHVFMDLNGRLKINNYAMELDESQPYEVSSTELTITDFTDDIDGMTRVIHSNLLGSREAFDRLDKGGLLSRLGKLDDQPSFNNEQGFEAEFLTETMEPRKSRLQRVGWFVSQALNARRLMWPSAMFKPGEPPAK